MAKCGMAMFWWRVTLHGKEIDQVPYTPSCDAEYVRRSLIDHDGYNLAIKVTRIR